MVLINETSRNESFFSQYLPLFWPVRQSRAALGPNLSLSQNTPISWYTYCYTYSYTITYIDIYQLMGVFCDWLKLCSTAALDCRTGQNKGRYRKQERSFLLVLLCISLRLLLQILYASIVHWGNKGHASVALLPVLSIVSKAIKLHQFIQMLVILYQLRSFK